MIKIKPPYYPFVSKFSYIKSAGSLQASNPRRLKWLHHSSNSSAVKLILVVDYVMDSSSIYTTAEKLAGQQDRGDQRWATELSRQFLVCLGFTVLTINYSAITSPSHHIKIKNNNFCTLAVTYLITKVGRYLTLLNISNILKRSSVRK